MTEVTRRESIAIGAGALAAGATVGSAPAHSAIPMANVPQPKLAIEPGATLRIIRPSKFVEADEVVWNENTARFSKTTGIPVRTDFVGWEDLRAQVAVTARTGAGPDVVVGWPADPFLYVDKIVDLTDIADYLGKKYGGWGPLPARFGKKFGTNSWIALPMGSGGGALVWRKSWVNEAGYEKPPNELDKFLDLARKLQKNGHPIGMALGNAVGDGNGTANWLMWSHGAYQVDEQNKVAINQKATIEALKHWQVEHGEIAYDGKNDSLCTEKDYADFELLVDWKIEPHGDSGIYLRGSPQVQIWDDEPAVALKVGSGGLYNNQKNPSNPTARADNPPGQWNRFRILMIGDKVTVFLNNVLVVQDVTMENYWERDKPIYPLGQIELQHHGSHLKFKNIYLREIKAHSN